MDGDTAAILAGAALQVLGVVIAVLKGWAIVSGWLKALRDGILGPKPTIHISGALAAGSADVHGYSDVKISGTTDEQLEALKNQLGELTKTVVTHDQQMRLLAKETDEGFEKERAERGRLDHDLRALIQANAPWAAAGAILVVLGIALATFGALH